MAIIGGRKKSRAKPGDTHYPASQGAVCGIVARDARDYDVSQPTCPDCSDYVETLRRVANPSALPASSGVANSDPRVALFAAGEGEPAHDDETEDAP